MKRQLLPFARLQIAALLAALIALTVVAPSTTSASEPAPNPGTAGFEIRFLSDMIDHHAMAVEMGELCLERAVHEELTAMCSDIVASQQQEIETMQAWLASWYGVSHQPEMSAGDMKKMERLASLSSEEFEIEFMQMMSKHHAMAVKMASRCLDCAYHAELVDMCSEIVAAQSTEIQQMQTWLCDWYGICRPARGSAG